MMIFGFGYCFNTYHVSWTMETQSSVLSMLERDNEQTSNVPAGSTSSYRQKTSGYILHNRLRALQSLELTCKCTLG